ncbi:MAG: hypothetical protein WKF79_00275 [Nocardioides sp.]
MPNEITLQQVDADLAEIALTVGGISTLQTRNSDRLDFHDLSVATVKAMLDAAFRKGAQRHRQLTEA